MRGSTALTRGRGAGELCTGHSLAQAPHGRQASDRLSQLFSEPRVSVNTWRLIRWVLPASLLHVPPPFGSGVPSNSCAVDTVLQGSAFLSSHPSQPEVTPPPSALPQHLTCTALPVLVIFCCFLYQRCNVRYFSHWTVSFLKAKAAEPCLSEARA